MPQFEHYIGIDYSGAETPTSSLSGSRVYAADWLLEPEEVPPPSSPRKYWTRPGIAEWLRDELSKSKPTIVGIDHGFSFPMRYFETHRLPPDWPKFLDDFQRHWPTDEDNTYVDFVREGVRGKGSKRAGEPTWLRLTESWTPSAKAALLASALRASAPPAFAALRYDDTKLPGLKDAKFDAPSAAAGKLKAIDDPLKIVIVRDMWLTGTDIPCLHTLYVDKPMKGHTLMQAIARVNRIFSNKPGGLVVDFIGIGDQLKEATKKYTQGGGAGDPAPDISEEAKAVFLQALADVRDLLPELPAGRSYGAWRALPNIEFEDLFLRCCGHLTETDELRDDFLAAEARLNSAFALVNHLADCIGYADEVVFYQLFRKQLIKTTSGPTPKDEEKAKVVRELLDRSIESKGVVDIFAAAGIEKEDISILEEKFLEEFKSHEQENLRLKLLAKILADEIRVRERMNLAKYRSFKEMLEQTLLLSEFRGPFQLSARASRTVSSRRTLHSNLSRAR